MNDTQPKKLADFDQVMAVNVRGLFLTVREGARRLMAIDRGG